jgi:hypothetical protein
METNAWEERERTGETKPLYVPSREEPVEKEEYGRKNSLDTTSPERYYERQRDVCTQFTRWLATQKKKETRGNYAFIKE